MQTAFITEAICNTNGCDAGEVILGVVFMFCVMIVIIGLIR